MLSDRRQKVLKALIEEYIAYAHPVGSRTLVDRYGLGVSSATVRNELSVLEDEGYLVSPHTSAGRIPTDAGYRAFVDDLLKREQRDDDRDNAAFRQLRDAASQVDDCIERTSSALARLTDCLSVVLAPSLLNLRLKQVSLISITPHRVLTVIVTEDGQVFNRSIEFADEVSADDLAPIQNALNAMIAGRPVADIGPNPSDFDGSDALSSPLARIIIDEMLVCLNEANNGKAHRLGLSSLLKKPEFSNARDALPVLKVLEDDTVLMHMFDDVGQGDEPSVRIGRENGTEGLSGVSVVAAQYGPEGGEGVVAVIGPTRMDYSRVIRAVRAAKDTLQDM